MAGYLAEREQPEFKVVPRLAAFGYAPGDYLNVCQDCPKGRSSLAFNALDDNQFIGAKHSWRCQQHAQEARDRFYSEEPDSE